jgi:4-amino-4-deoxy-L-arabinose transferase-like glycosyltransferase
MVNWNRPAVPHIFNLSILLAIAWLLFVFNLASVPFYERGEPREALVVVEMHSSGNVILPLVNGEYIPFKPPLFHWIALIAAKLFGRIDEFSLRLPSALFGTLGVLLTYFAGARLWCERAGFVAAVILLSNIQWWNGATIVQVDMTLTFFLIASLIGFFFIYRNPVNSQWKAYGLAVLVACATLAKGPLGVIVPLAVIGVFLALRGDFACLKKFYPWRSAALYLLLAGPWYALALWQGGEPFFSRQIIDETVGTATGEIGHMQPLYYYLPIFLANFSPWSLFALPFLLSWRRRRSGPSMEVFS